MKYIKLSLVAAFLIICTGCDKYLDVNSNPNNPEDVQEKLILSPVEYNLAQGVVGGWASVHVNHFMQTVALNQPVPNVGTYLLANTDENDTWYYLYTICLQNLHLLNSKAEANSNLKYAGIAKVLTAYCLGYGTTLWGDIPYSEAFAGSGNFYPTYDSQEDIYKTIQDLLDKGIANLEAGTGLTPGSDDYLYNGDADKWIRAAYTLKARYYMHLTKAPGYNAATQAGLALAALEKGMQSNDDDLEFPYPGGAGTQNRWYSNFLPVETLILSAHTVDLLKDRQDPRISKLVALSEEDGVYRGREIGTEGIGSLGSYSIGGTFYAGEASSLVLINYREALFLKAEADLLTDGYAAAQESYTAAIQADMSKLGVSGSSAAYLASRGTLTATNALERIMEEKSIANIFSVEVFSDWRRTGYPALSLVPHALFPAIPRRLIYPNSEISTNPQPQQTATLKDRMWSDPE